MAELLYFDRQDRALLKIINDIIDNGPSSDLEQKIFKTSLHPHGILNLTTSHEFRMAQAVINLLGRVMKIYRPYVFEHDAVPYLKGNSMQTFQWKIGVVSPMDCYVCTDSFMEIQIRQ